MMIDQILKACPSNAAEGLPAKATQPDGNSELGKLINSSAYFNEGE
jgi:hypothetical protein